MSSFHYNKVLQREKFTLRMYAIFLLCLVIDIGGAFGLKYFSFFLILVYLAVRILNGTINIPINFILVEGNIFLFIPILLLAYSTLVHSLTLKLSIAELTPFATWIIYLLLINISSKEELIKQFKKVGYLGALLIILTFVLIEVFYLVGKMDLVTIINLFATKYQLGYLGQNPLGVQYSLFIPSVYYRWSMLLIPISLLFINDKKVRFFTILTALTLTLSTGIIVFSIIALCLFIFLYKRKLGSYLNIFYKLLLLTASFTLLLILFKLGIIELVFSKFSGESYSTSVKLGHISSAYDEIVKSPLVFLFGSGIGSSFYSKGIEAITVNIEVSHINLIRQYGILYFLIFVTYISVVFLKVMKTDDTGKQLGIGLIALFFAVGTNPLLISPVFFIVLIIARAYIELSSREG